jgi:predicted dehydrogenase
MSIQPFCFVVLGSGNISRTYFNAIANLENAAVAALVSRSGKRPDFVASGLPVFESLTSVNVPFDAVILCTPNGLHHQGAIEAARLGKHVLTEKVLDISREHMDAMEAACAKAGVRLAVSFQRRMSPDNAALKRLLEKGALGRVFAADMRVKFHRDMNYYGSGDYRGGYGIDGGGAFIQQAAHNADLLCWFFGLPRTVVSMLGTFTHPIEAEDHGVALLRYPDGMIGTFTASTSTKPGFPTEMEIHSDKGSLLMRNDEFVTWTMEGVDQPERAPGFEVHSGSNTAAVADTAGHEAILSDFIEAVRTNREPAVPATSGRLATELILRIYEANLP